MSSFLFPNKMPFALRAIKINAIYMSYFKPKQIEEKYPFLFFFFLNIQRMQDVLLNKNEIQQIANMPWQLSEINLQFKKAPKCSSSLLISFLLLIRQFSFVIPFSGPLVSEHHHCRAVEGIPVICLSGCLWMCFVMAKQIGRVCLFENFLAGIFIRMVR